MKRELSRIEEATSIINDQFVGIDLEVFEDVSGASFYEYFGRRAVLLMPTGYLEALKDQIKLKSVEESSEEQQKFYVRGCPPKNT